MFVADRTQPAFQPTAAGPRQYAGRHATVVGQLGAATFQYFGIRTQGCRQSEGLRNAVGRQGWPCASNNTTAEVSGCCMLAMTPESTLEHSEESPPAFGVSMDNGRAAD